MSKPTGMINPFAAAAANANQVVAPATQQDKPSGALKTKGIMFRLTPADWKRVKDYSTIREKSVQELMETAFNMLLKSEGLEPIDGLPRSRK